MHNFQNLQSLNSDLTPDVMIQVDEIVNRFKDQPGCLIPVLTECQGVTGYLPVELQEYLSYGLNIPASTVYGVVTFYSFFTMVPKGRHTIKVCMGTACYLKGAGDLISELENLLDIGVGGTTPDGKFSIEAVRCVGCCGLAPVLMVGGEVYGKLTTEMLPEVLAHYND